MFWDRYDIGSRSKAQFRGVVATAQNDWEIKELIEIYDQLQPKHVLEIGSQYGGTLYYWMEQIGEGVKIGNIDILQNMEEVDQRRLPKLWASWANTGTEYQAFIGRSDDQDIYNGVHKFFDGWLDFLWIDADHSYKGAKHDFIKYGPMVKDGGIIALHDIVTPSWAMHIQVAPLWEEIQSSGYITRELKCGADWGGIGVVYVGDRI